MTFTKEEKRLRANASAMRHYRANKEKCRKVSCFYCGRSIDTVGLDRVNNKRGYTLKNIVACCGACDIAKRSMTQAAFITLYKAIATCYGG